MWWCTWFLTVKKSKEIIGKCVPLVIFLIDLKLSSVDSLRDYSVDVVRLEAVAGTTRTLVSRSLRLERNAAHEYGIVGSFTYLEDFGNDVMVRGSLATSTRGNNEFVPSRMRIPQMPFCVFLNTTWRDYVQPSLENCSTFPKLPAKGLCPFPKGNYEMNCSKLIITDKWPSHLPRGLWRFNLSHTKNDEFIGGYTDYLNVDDL